MAYPTGLVGGHLEPESSRRPAPARSPTTQRQPSTSPARGDPFFTVVLPTFNRAQLLLRAVDSILAQRFSDFELVVVDDGSSDDTGSVVSAIADSRVRGIRQLNCGMTTARNTGANIARGTYLVFLDDDDELCPGALDEFYRLLQVDESALAWCAAEIACPDTGVRRIAAPADLGPVFDNFRGVFLLGSFSVRRDLFLQAGGFADGLPSSELAELSMRLLPLCARCDARVTGSNEVVVQVNQNVPGKRPNRAPEPLLAAMTYVLEHHHDRVAKSPEYLANCLGIAGVSLARLGRLSEARKRLWQAARADPRRLRNYGRFAVACVPFLARRVWPVLS
jgi:glycosyltransferase involved in cell wall biosynthesis